MTRMNTDYKNIKRLAGWLAWTDYELLTDLIRFQTTFSNSALLEIGVHHGKSFIPLARCSNERRLYVIDIFGDQCHNLDHSGKGDLAAFKQNIRRYGIDDKRIVIDQRMSTDVQPYDIESKVGKVGFFHIDGGHHYDAVISDINLAVATSANESLIVLDDVFRPEWPQVSFAAFGSEILKDSGFVTFAIGFNKAFFCRKDYVSKYQNHLRKNIQLNKHLSKTYPIGDRTILVYQRYPLPEWGIIKLAYWYLSIWHPVLFNRIIPSVETLTAMKNKFFKN